MAAPLEGIRVLDLTRFLAGPFAGMILADYGADVIRVESPKGRELRGTGEVRDNYFFLSANRGKRSLTIDLANPDGAELLLRLAGEADVLLENFRPGVMERWGLGGKTLTERCFTVQDFRMPPCSCGCCLSYACGISLPQSCFGNAYYSSCN